MVEIINFGKFKNFEKNKNKKQIILCNTYRNGINYLNSLKFRKNGSYKKIPNYIITKEGKVISVLPDDSVSFFFQDSNINKNSIFQTSTLNIKTIPIVIMILIFQSNVTHYSRH